MTESYSDASSLYLTYETQDGAFCCKKAYDTMRQVCPQGPSQLFNLNSPQVIFNRTDGSVLNSDTIPLPQLAEAADVSTVTVTATATVTADRAGVGSSSRHDTTAVAAGIAVPLGELLIAALVTCVLLYRQARRPKSEQERAQSLGLDVAQAKLGQQDNTFGYGESRLRRGLAVQSDGNPRTRTPYRGRGHGGRRSAYIAERSYYPGLVADEH